MADKYNFDSKSKKDIVRNGKESPLRHKKEIEIQDVSFEYSHDATVTKALAEVSFSVSKGQLVALIGANGSGKSTLMHLIQGLYHPTRGKILLDGEDLETIPKKVLRRMIVAVPQDILLLNRSILENITYGKKGASMEEVKKAAKRARAHDFISALPNGYNTIVGPYFPVFL
jgi:ATP-binding cassette subfamily B protein